MPAPVKDSLDIAIDFFYGVLGGLVVCAVIAYKYGTRYLVTPAYFNTYAYEAFFVAGALIGGSLAALCRNDFWGLHDSYVQLPPTEERVTRLWQIALFGVLLVGLLLLGAIVFLPLFHYPQVR